MNIRTITATFAVTAFATPALADLTADDVLSAMTDQLGAFDLLTVSVQGKERDGDTLKVARISATANIDDVPMTFSFGPMTYQDMNDGSVAILYPEPLQVKLTSTDGDTPVVVSTEVEVTDATHIATGSPERLRYAFSAASMEVNELIIEADETLEPEMKLVLTNITSVVENAIGATFYQAVDYAFDTLTVDFKLDEPEEDLNSQMVFALADVKADYEVEVSLDTLMTSVAQALQDGNRLSLNMTTGEYVQIVTVDTPFEQSDMTSRTANSDLIFSVNKNGLVYQAGYGESTAEMTGHGLPFGAFTYGLEEANVTLAFPLLPSDDAQRFALQMLIQGMTVGDDIWNLFDAGRQLPRDPVDFVLDLEGTTRVTEDFLVLDKLENMQTPPFADTQLQLNQLRISAAGAELTGDGTVTDTTKNGIPSGIGQLNMMLTGGNGLLDTLVDMGVLPSEQAMGARMMLGMFARPGDGEDTLVSTIEVNEDGSITANGQRIK